MTNFEKFVSGYMTCAAWSSAPEGSNARFPKSEWAVAAADCRAFIERCGALIEEAAESYDWDSLGHDFWLCRTGAGCGFQDRGALAHMSEVGTVYGRSRWGGAFYSVNADSIGDALHDIAYGTSAHISEFAYAELSAYRGWLYFS